MVLLSNSPSLPEVSTLQFSLTSSVGTVPFGRVPFSTESSRRAGFDFTYTDKIYETPLSSSRIVNALKGYNVSLNTKTDGDTNLITTGNDGKQWFLLATKLTSSSSTSSISSGREGSTNAAIFRLSLT